MEQERMKREEQRNTRPKTKRTPRETVRKRPPYSAMEEPHPVRRARPAGAENGTPMPPKKKRPRPEGAEKATQAERPVRRVRTEDEAVKAPIKKVTPERKSSKQPSKSIAREEKSPKRTAVQRKKVRGKKTFKKALLTSLIIFSAILVAALICLWFFLSSFEKSRPEHYAQAIIRNIEDGKYEDLHLVTADGLSLDDGSLMADKKTIGNIIKSKIDASDTSYRRLSSESDENKNVYLVKTGDEKLLKVELVKADKKFIFGFSDWKEKETVLLSPDLQPKLLKAQIPTSSKLYVNGNEVPETFITEAAGEIELLNRLREWGIIGEQPKVTTFSISGIWENPEVTYAYEGGNPTACVLENNLYSGGFEADQDFIDEVYGRVIDCMEPYAYYFSGDAGRGAIANIMLDNSPAYDNATSADVSWMQEHSDVQITEKKAENFKHYSEGVFSCDISFLETIYQGDEAVKTWDTNMTWIFVWDADNYYLADFVTNVGD